MVSVISGTQLRDSCHAIWEVGLPSPTEFAAVQMRRKQMGKAIVQGRIMDRRRACAFGPEGLCSGTLGTSLRSGRRPHNQK